MKQKIIAAVCASILLLFAVGVSAEPVTIVYSCTLKDGKTKDEAMEVNARWLKWARATAGTDDVTSSYVTAVVGDFEGFMWVDAYPSAAAWARLADTDSPFDEEFDELMTCKGNRMYRGELTEPAR